MEGIAGAPPFCDDGLAGDPVLAKPERVVVPVILARGPDPVLELAPTVVPVAVAVAPEAMGSAANRSDDWYVTQLDEAGIRGVYGIVEIGPRDSGGWTYDVVTPFVVYTPGKSWFSESHISKT